MDGASVFYTCQKPTMVCSVWLSCALLMPSPETQTSGLEKKPGYLPTHSWLTRKKKERKAHDAGRIIKNV